MIIKPPSPLSLSPAQGPSALHKLKRPQNADTKFNYDSLSLAWHRVLGPNEEMMKCSRAQNKQVKGEGKRQREKQQTKHRQKEGEEEQEAGPKGKWSR